MMNIRQVAALTGTSVRTLHHYDEIGLLCPARNGENGYRAYTDDDLDRLQQVLFFKQCGFSLDKIGQLLDSPDFDREKAFELQQKYLLHERERIDAMLETLAKTQKAVKGEIEMSNTEKFRGFDFTQNPYEEEARRLWGDAAVDGSKAHMASLSSRKKQALAAGMDGMFKELAALRGEDPASAAVQGAMERFHRFLNENVGHHYTPAAFAGLGQMYAEDERFTRNIDSYGQGLAAFLAGAMGEYARQKEGEK